MEKKVLCHERLRRVPRQFSWADQRLMRDEHLGRCSAAAWGLYLFLILVGDAQGLSYYSDSSICRTLSIPGPILLQLRQELVSADVIVYRKPLYQVLGLDEPISRRSKDSQPISIGDLLSRIARGGN